MGQTIDIGKLHFYLNYPFTKLPLISKKLFMIFIMFDTYNSNRYLHINTLLIRHDTLHYYKYKIKKLLSTLIVLIQSYIKCTK